MSTSGSSLGGKVAYEVEYVHLVFHIHDDPVKLVDKAVMIETPES